MQMIYFVLVALALGFVKAEKSAVLELNGDAPTVHFGELGGSDTLTLIHSPGEDKLTCSGTIEASDVRIAGTSTTVAQMITEFAQMKEEMAAVKNFVGMTPPSTPPLSTPQATHRLSPGVAWRSLTWHPIRTRLASCRSCASTWSWRRQRILMAPSTSLASTRTLCSWLDFELGCMRSGGGGR